MRNRANRSTLCLGAGSEFGQVSILCVCELGASLLKSTNLETVILGLGKCIFWVVCRFPFDQLLPVSPVGASGPRSEGHREVRPCISFSSCFLYCSHGQAG